VRRARPGGREPVGNRMNSRRLTSGMDFPAYVDRVVITGQDATDRIRGRLCHLNMKRCNRTSRTSRDVRAVLAIGIITPSPR